MLKFFRKIRQQLLTENKVSNYLIYAIGEIVLVVIGILIALQINNWNENTKLEIEETRLLKQLNIEFKNNKKALEVVDMKPSPFCSLLGGWCTFVMFSSYSLR